MGMLVRIWWEYKMVQLLWKHYGGSSEKLSIELSYGPAIPLLGVYSQKNWEQGLEWINLCSFIVASFMMTKRVETGRWWMDG